MLGVFFSFPLCFRSVHLDDEDLKQGADGVHFTSYEVPLEVGVQQLRSLKLISWFGFSVSPHNLLGADPEEGPL